MKTTSHNITEVLMKVQILTLEAVHRPNYMELYALIRKAALHDICRIEAEDADRFTQSFEQLIYDVTKPKS